MKLTTEILLRGGRVLMPVFALGRAQELLLILDEYWEKYPKFQTYPIYYASNLARKCMDVYRTYINTMNDKIKKAMFEGEGRNPWDFKWVRSLKNIERFDDVGGCVMLASPGMLQVGPLPPPSPPLLPLPPPSPPSLLLPFALRVRGDWCEAPGICSPCFHVYSSVLYRSLDVVSNHVCVNEIYIVISRPPLPSERCLSQKTCTDLLCSRTEFRASCWSAGRPTHATASSSPATRLRARWPSRLSRSRSRSRPS